MSHSSLSIMAMSDSIGGIPFVCTYLVGLVDAANAYAVLLQILRLDWTSMRGVVGWLEQEQFISFPISNLPSGSTVWISPGQQDGASASLLLIQLRYIA